MQRSDRFSLIVSLLLGIGLMGYVVWTQRPVPSEPVVAAAAARPVPPPASDVPPAPEALPLDETRAAELRAAAEATPGDVQARVDVGNLYFDSHLFEEAIPWFEEALILDPTLIDVSTDLGVAFFYIDDTPRALAQFASSLETDPTHAKTILNIGIVRAFGAQDLEGAFEAWEEVQRVAPGSAEALAAADAIARLSAAH